MKIQHSHYVSLKNAIDQFTMAHPDLYKIYKENGLSDMRYRWDVLRSAQFIARCGRYTHKINGITWICDNLYSYLNDDHIDTALRKITNTH